MEIRLPPGFDQTGTGGGVAKQKLGRTEAVQHCILGQRQNFPLVSQQHDALSCRLQRNLIVVGIGRVYLPSGKRPEFEGLTPEGGSICCSEPGERNGIFFPIFCCHLAHRYQHAVHLDRNIHKKAGALGYLLPINGDGTVTVFCQGLTQAHRKPIGNLDEGGVLSLNLI